MYFNCNVNTRMLWWSYLQLIAHTYSGFWSTSLRTIHPWATVHIQNCTVLGYYAASSRNSLPTFRDNPSVPAARGNNPTWVISFTPRAAYFSPQKIPQYALNMRKLNTGRFANWMAPTTRWLKMYEGVSKIFRTGAAIYTAVVVVRSTGRW
jgi:hypothetical protein